MEEIKRKTKREILVETIRYYRNNPYGYDKKTSACVYYGPNGEMCAVGRCLINPQAFEGISATATELFEEDDEILKPEYRGHQKEFWMCLQIVHDDTASSKGLFSKVNVLEKRNYIFHKLVEMIKEDEKRN